MDKFRFAIMGAGYIARKFADAVESINNAQVVAVSSKSSERAEEFALEKDIENFYSSYEEMLKNEDIDAVYIATTHNFHYELLLLCLGYKVPVICEKPMVITYNQAVHVLGVAKKEKVFVMEAMWSRFMPAIKRIKMIIEEGRIGDVVLANFDIGFNAPYNKESRLFNPKLAGGASFDITVYGYEILTYLIDQEIENIRTVRLETKERVDHTNNVIIKFENCIGNINSTLVVPNFSENMTIYATKGKIVMPRPHFGEGFTLYDEEGKVVEEYTEPEKNGFIYQAKEVIECVKRKKIESQIATHDMTLSCSQLFDKINK